MSDIASEAGGAEAPQAPDTSAPEGTETTQQAPDFSGLEQFLDQRFSAQQQHVQEQIQQALAPAEPEPEAADPYSGLGELGYSDEETQATRQVLQGILGQEIQNAVGPLQQEIRRLRSELDYGDLEDRYPNLATEEGAQKVMGESRQAAERIAQGLGLGPEIAQQLAMSPQLMEFVHLAQIGRERAAQEQPAQPGAELEQPGGASPPEPEPDVNDLILGASPKNNFWGY